MDGEGSEMKKLTLICATLVLAITILGIFNLNLSISFARMESAELQSEEREPTLQEWFDQNEYTINVTADETGIETFEAGYYKVTILTEIADYAPANNLSWYPASTGYPNYVFLGENVTGDATYFLATETFGLCLGSPDGNFYTEPQRNMDESDHALVFLNSNASGYIVAWEDLWTLGDSDFQDFVLAALTPIKVDVWYCPRTLNLKSCGRWITAIIKLPENYKAEDVDVSSILLNGTISAEQAHYTKLKCEDSHILVVKFSRKTLIKLIKNTLEETEFRKFFKVSLTLTGRFFDGTPFQGTNKIRVIRFMPHCCHCKKC